MLGSLFVVCRFSKHFSAVHSVVIVRTGDVRLLFKLLLQLRNVLIITESRSFLTCNENIQEDIPTALELSLGFETKRHTCKQIFHENIDPGNPPVTSAEELGTMSKNNLRGITLVRGPIWGVHSLALIISCEYFSQNSKNN